MVILHIAAIRENACTGVSVAVPQHICAQQELESVGFVNLTNTKIRGIKNQFIYKEPFALSNFADPFCKPDLVVFHEVYYPKYLKISAYLRKQKIPYIIIPHGTLAKNAQKKKRIKKFAANLLFFNRFIKEAKAIQFLSQSELQNSAFGKRKFVGTNGIFVPQIKKMGFNTESVRLLYIGSLALYIKGLDVMLEAVGLTGEVLRKNNAKLYLYGPDYKTRHSDIRHLIEKYNISDIVELHDKIVGEAKEKELLNADVFIQTSRSEAMSMGILEALSYGLPCLVTDGTNMQEFVENNKCGWTADTDAQSIAGAIEQAVKERAVWQEKSENARKFIESEFSWDKVSQATIEKYKAILS